MNKILCFGTNGGCLDSYYLCKEIYPNDEISFLSDVEKTGDFINDSMVVGGFSDIKNFQNLDYYFIFQCGNVLNHKKRDLWFNNSLRIGLKPKTLISEKAYINKSAKVGEGSIIYPGVKIMRDVIIGTNTIVLPNTVINHDVHIGSFSIINSGCVINGNTKIGKKCYVGAGSIFKEKLKIKDKSTIGMGSLVLEDIDKEGLYFGSPAKFISSN
tara:strand:- start:675 stop:1313 length:639 start_codon:yes stop_codon:yes gene_type:complete